MWYCQCEGRTSRPRPGRATRRRRQVSRTHHLAHQLRDQHRHGALLPLPCALPERRQCHDIANLSKFGTYSTTYNGYTSHAVSGNATKSDLGVSRASRVPSSSRTRSTSHVRQHAALLHQRAHLAHDPRMRQHAALLHSGMSNVSTKCPDRINSCQDGAKDNVSLYGITTYHGGGKYICKRR